MKYDTTENLNNRLNLYERLTPEVQDQLSAMTHSHLREYITELLQEKQYFTEVTVGDMCAILQALDRHVTVTNYIALFNDHQ